MHATKILLVNDDRIEGGTLCEVPRELGFEIGSAASVPEPSKLISSEIFDPFPSDPNSPGAEAATYAIVRQTDEIVVKPMKLTAPPEVIKQTHAIGRIRSREIESVATILDRTSQATVQEWYERIQTVRELMSIPMSYEQRTGHLPQVFHDLASRLRSDKLTGSGGLLSTASTKHGLQRFRLGYTGAMMVEESRMLEISIFHTLQNNRSRIDFSVLLIGVMTIADEIDSQLSQAMASYMGAVS
jgi:hypothetical protein